MSKPDAGALDRSTDRSLLLVRISLLFSKVSANGYCKRIDKNAKIE
jgi:hypothetical protein